MNSWFYLILDTSESIERQCKAIFQFLLAKTDMTLKIANANVFIINPLNGKLNSSITVSKSTLTINVHELTLGVK